jgi:hypothetical protein
MLRQKTPDGWFLIRHPDHAALAGQFALAWGNAKFRKPAPFQDWAEGVRRHDDGWAERDRTPTITSAGKPSAFGADLVGGYTAFEEIDLPEYLGVRGRAMEIVAADNPYSAILISMHTCNLLTEHADRSTIRPDQLVLLDRFVTLQRQRQLELRAEAAESKRFTDEDLSVERLLENFRLLQACDNLSLLSCVDYDKPATLLHPLPLVDGTTSEVTVQRTALRTFRLSPWPLNADSLEFEIPGRPVTGDLFPDSKTLQAHYAAAPTVMLTVRIHS